MSQVITWPAMILIQLTCIQTITCVYRYRKLEQSIKLVVNMIKLMKCFLMLVVFFLCFFPSCSSLLDLSVNINTKSVLLSILFAWIKLEEKLEKINLDFLLIWNIRSTIGWKLSEFVAVGRKCKKLIKLEKKQLSKWMFGT